MGHNSAEEEEEEEESQKVNGEDKNKVNIYEEDVEENDSLNVV